MYMNYYNYYENLRIKQDKKLKKCKLEANLFNEDLQNIGDIYDGIMEKNVENFDNFITERKMYRKRISLTGKLFNHSKRVSSPRIESGYIQYNYRNNYNSPMKINIINNVERQHKQLIHKREITNNINHINYINNIQGKQIIQENIPKKDEINLDNSKNQFKINFNNEIQKQSVNQNINRININNQNQQIFTNYNNLIINKSQNPQYNLELSKNIQQTNNKTIKNLSYISSPSYIQMNQQNSGSIAQNQNTQLQRYNLSNTTNTTTATKKIISTKIEQNQNQTQAQIKQNEKKRVVTEIARASVHQIVGEISKRKTIMTNTQFLSPIRKKTINIKNSVSPKAIITHKINKEIVEERTLPVSYLPEKVNEIIYHSQIIYLPVMNIGNKDNYKIIQPTINEFKVYVNEGNKNIINNNINLFNNSGNNNSNIFDKENKTNFIQIPKSIIKNEHSNNAMNSYYKDILKSNLSKITQNNMDINFESSN